MLLLYTQYFTRVSCTPGCLLLVFCVLWASLATLLPGGAWRRAARRQRAQRRGCECPLLAHNIHDKTNIQASESRHRGNRIQVCRERQSLLLGRKKHWGERPKSHVAWTSFLVCQLCWRICVPRCLWWVQYIPSCTCLKTVCIYWGLSLLLLAV